MIALETNHPTILNMRPTVVELRDYYLIYSKGYWIEFYKDTKQVQVVAHADNLADAIRDEVVIKKMKTSEKETKEMLKELASQLRTMNFNNDPGYCEDHGEIIEYLVSHF